MGAAIDRCTRCRRMTHTSDEDVCAECYALADFERYVEARLCEDIVQDTGLDEMSASEMFGTAVRRIGLAGALDLLAVATRTAANEARVAMSVDGRSSSRCVRSNAPTADAVTMMEDAATAIDRARAIVRGERNGEGR